MAENRAKFVPGSIVDVTWRKSTFSAYNGSCVEVADLAPGQIGVRDSKAGPHGPVLVFGQADWASFLRTLKH
jgi:hypothetical protein